MAKDLRNGREYGRWHPGRWSGAHLVKYMRDVEAAIISELQVSHGMYEGSRIAAEAISNWSGLLSAALLHQERILTYGEVLSNGNTSTKTRE